MRIRQAPFALRVVQRSAGMAAVVYRRQGDEQGLDRLRRVAALSPLAFTAATPLLQEAVACSAAPHGQAANGKARAALTAGAFHPLDADWGARVACFALLAAGLRDGERLLSAAGHLRHADANDSAWWLGLLTREENTRALRALRILTEAVE